MKLANWQAADADYARVIELETDDGRLRAAERTRAECLLRMGQFGAAADVFLQEMFLSPRDWGGMRDASLSALLADNPAVARMAVGRVFQQLSGNKELDGYWSGELIRLHTAIPGLVTNDNQQRLLEAAAKTGGDWTLAYTAAIHYRLGDFEKAQALLDTPIQDREFQSLAAMLLYDRGETTRAAEYLRRAESWFQQQSESDPRSVIPGQDSWNIWAKNRTAWREAARKLIGPRITELDELLAKEPDKIAELLERAELLADAGLHEGALDDLDRLVALKVNSPESDALNGRILAGLNRAEEALPYLNQAIEAGSEDAGVYAARGVILLKQQQIEQARDDLEKSLELEPTALAAGSLANLLLAEAENTVTDDPAAADRESKRLAALKLADPWEKLIAVYEMIGDQPAIDQLLERRPQAAVTVADVAAAGSNWEQVIVQYNKLITDDTTDASLFSKRAEAYFATAQWDLARADVRRAVTQRPDLAKTEFDRDRLAQRWSEAAEFGSLLIEQNPENTMLWVQVPPVAVLSDDAESYRHVCRQIIEQFLRSPTPENADRAIKGCLLRHGAIDVADLPLDKLPMSLDEATAPTWLPPWFWATRALLAYRSGDAEGAVKFVTQSEAKAPNDRAHALNLAVLAMAQHDLKNVEAARATLGEASQVITKIQAVDKNHHDVLIAEILFREAESLNNGSNTP
jgi:tetratricopeptide (TPR) repeat protein